MSRYSSQTTYDLAGVKVPLAGVTVYVYASETGQLATLTTDAGAALGNPLTSDGYGNFYFNAATGLYDLRYIVGGKTVYQEDGVAVGGYSATYRAIAIDVVNTTALTVTGAAGQAVTTRGLLAGIASPVNGQTAYLTEAGRQGWFQFSTANLSASVTADSFQGLYVAPTAAPTGASGAWVRDVRGQEYQASWWGVSTAVANNSPILASALALLSAGGELHLDGGTFPQTTALGPIARDNWSLIGKGNQLTVLQMAVGSGAIGNLGFGGSNIRIEGVGFKTNSTHDFANNAPNVGAGFPNGASAPLFQNWRFINCRFEGGALGLICTGSDDNNVTLTRAKDVYIQGCVFVNDTQGVSIAACENVEVVDCRFDMIASTQNGASACIRSWGSKNVKFVNCFGTATNEFGFLLSTFARATGTTTIRLANEGIRIENCNFTNCLADGVHVTECKGLLEILNSTFTANTASTVLSFGINFQGGFAAISGLVPICDKVKIKGVTCIGYAVGFAENMAIRNLELQNFEVIGNSNVTAYPGGTICGLMAGGIVLLEVLNSKFLMSDQHLGSRFRIATGNSSQKVRLIGNSLPEGGGINVSDVSSGGVVVQESVNVDYGAGTFAAHIAP